MERKSRHKGLICSKWTTSLARALQGYLRESGVFTVYLLGKKHLYRNFRIKRVKFVIISTTQEIKKTKNKVQAGGGAERDAQKTEHEMHIMALIRSGK